MKKLPVLVLPCLLISSLAHADWTGMYAGANAGYGWNSSSMRTEVKNPANYFTGSDVAAIAAVGESNPDSSNFVGGGQVGYHWQYDRFIMGFDLDLNSYATKLTTETTSGYPGSSSTFTIKQKMQSSWMTTFRPHFGYAHNRFLGYVTGGLAVTDMRSTAEFYDDTGSNAYEKVSQPSTKAGWTIGAGMGYAIDSAWSVGVEYLYTSFGNISMTGQLEEGEVPVAEMEHDADLTSNIVRFVVNCHFG